jgi:hypothetical protein
MAYVKDQWTRPVKQDDGTILRVRTARWGRGKGWLAGWIDPGGNERTKALSTKVPAERHANAMETDRERGEYIDPDAGKVRFEVVPGGGWHREWSILRLRSGTHGVHRPARNTRSRGG